MNALVNRFTSWVSSRLSLAGETGQQASALGSAGAPMTGLWRELTPEQKERALSFGEKENHGDPNFTRKL
jgi:hypothetical protein